MIEIVRLLNGARNDLLFCDTPEHTLTDAERHYNKTRGERHLCYPRACSRCRRNNALDDIEEALKRIKAVFGEVR